MGGTFATPDVMGSGDKAGTRTWLMRRSRPLGVRSAACQGSAEKVPLPTAARKSESLQADTGRRCRGGISRPGLKSRAIVAASNPGPLGELGILGGLGLLDVRS